VVASARQDPGLSSKPDLVAVPVDKSAWRPIYSKSIAVEVKPCNEVETHPEQVARNWVKESVRNFAEIHTWTWDKCYGRVKNIYEKVRAIDKCRVKIFNAKTQVKKPIEEVHAKLTEASFPTTIAARTVSATQTWTETTCSSGQVAFTLSSGKVVRISVNLEEILKMFVNKGYRVEATKTKIVVYDKHGEEVFSSSL